MGTVSTNKGDFIFQSIDDTIKFVQTAAREKSDIWISGDNEYPCMAVCTNGQYATVNFFQNDTAYSDIPIGPPADSTVYCAKTSSLPLHMINPIVGFSCSVLPTSNLYSRPTKAKLLPSSNKNFIILSVKASFNSFPL